MFRMEAGRDCPPNINDVRDQNASCDTSQNLASPFDGTHQQQEKWYEEIEEKEEHANPAPAIPDATDIPRNFVRQISGPDNQELSEFEIRPEHGKCQKQVPNLVKRLILRDNRSELPGVNRDGKQ